MAPTDYVGRFAPSPTGRLHFGSLLAAVASFAQARQQSGQWLIRIEDLDPPRERPGAASAFITDLAAFGMTSDQPVILQSERSSAYELALEQLARGGLLFPCGCSRKDLAGTPVYPGTCANGLPEGRKARTLRVRAAGTITLVDDIQGPICENLDTQVGAFVVRRADGLTAYQLAVVVDDAFQGVTEVVRGSDLLDSTARQVFLQQALGLPTPGYAHIPVAINDWGNKLSKQTGAPELDPQNPLPSLGRAWRFLGQKPPPRSSVGSVDNFWRWAVPHWRLDRIPKKMGIAEYSVSD